MEKTYVSFEVGTIEAIRLEVRNGSNVAEKEIFNVDNQFYFYYVLNRSKKAQTFSLREITEADYANLKDVLLKQRPRENCRNWFAGDSIYTLKLFFNGRWKRTLSTSDCIFITDDNPLKELCESVEAQASLVQDRETSLDKQKKISYAKQCGHLSHKLGVNYTNVLRIGPDRDKILQFRKSWQDAVYAVTLMPLKEQRRIYVGLNSGRGSRKEILEELNVQYFNADPQLMDFSELMDEIQKRLKEYADDSLKFAIQNASEMDYDERMAVFEKINQNPREIKRQALSELGVDVEAIDLKSYPISRIRIELAATLGISLGD